MGHLQTWHRRRVLKGKDRLKEGWERVDGYDRGQVRKENQSRPTEDMAVGERENASMQQGSAAVQENDNVCFFF